LYEASGRTPHASINFVTAHDGFTLTDLVSYNEKHNEANLEDNRDGHNHNLSWNCGVEGPTDDVHINALRARQKRNLVTTLLLSQGVPMLLAGDEIGRTQQGNNNAYCQDNELSWVDWTIDAEKQALLAFFQRMIQLRRQHLVFRRRHFFQGRPIRGGGIKDIAWLTPEGREMNDDEWNQNFARSLGVYFAGEALKEVDRRGHQLRDDNFLLLLNAHHEKIAFTLPQFRVGSAWQVLVDTAYEEGLTLDGRFAGAAPYELQGRSLALFTEIMQA
jgi:glycogen operon protein